MNSTLRKIRVIADYQFGTGVGKCLFPDDIEISTSKRTGRIRHIFLNNKLLATLRAHDGLLSLSIDGGNRLAEFKPLHSWIKITSEVAEYVTRGRTVFSKHVVDCDPDIKPGDEVIVFNSSSKVIAVGKAVLTGKEMKVFQSGVAIKVRHGVSKRKIQS